MSLLLFSRLGFYPLWDDEANTAIFSQNVWKTGDTNGIYGHNLIAYRDGVELDPQLRGRIVPPLSHTYAAFFVGALGATPFSVRFPFAFAAFLAVFFMLFWLYREKTDRVAWCVFSLGITGNISFVLFGRQGRYYALTCLFALLVVFFYSERLRRSSRSSLWGLNLFASLLLATHYLAYAGLVAALFLDWLIWSRRQRAFALHDIFFCGLFQALIALPIVWIWFPLGKKITHHVPKHWLYERMCIFWVSLRDLNTAEFAPMLLILVGLILLCLRIPHVWPYGRVMVGLLTAAFVVSVFSPQPGKMHVRFFSDIRYLSFLLPGCIFVSSAIIHTLPTKAWLRCLVALLAFHSTLFHIPFAYFSGPPFIPLRSTSLAYLQELYTPQQSPYGATAKWVNQHVQPKQSILTVPDYATYPLMFHAPHALYAWQFHPRSRKRFPQLAAIHFQESNAWPDFIIQFGRDVISLPTISGSAHGLVRYWKSQNKAHYKRVAQINVFAYNTIRPELFLRRFSPKLHFDQTHDAIFIYQRFPQASSDKPTPILSPKKWPTSRSISSPTPRFKNPPL